MEKNNTPSLATTSTNSFNKAFPAEAVHNATVKCIEIYSRRGGERMRKEVLQDLTQDIEVKVLSAWDRFDPSKSKLETWVSRIATNCIRDAYKSEMKRASRFVSLESRNRDGDEYIDSAIELAVSGYEADRDIESREAQGRIQDAWDSLPEKQGYILSLYVDEELKPRQIASVVGLSSQAVSSQLYKARKSVAESLGEEFLTDKGLVS